MGNKIKAKHAIITPTCQKNRTPNGAWGEAVFRLWEEYETLRKLEVNKSANFHLVLQVERE